MPPIIKNVTDPESLNKPDDSAHERFNETTLKDTDERDEDGHLRRKGTCFAKQISSCTGPCYVCISYL